MRSPSDPRLPEHCAPGNRIRVSAFLPGVSITALRQALGHGYEVLPSTFGALCKEIELGTSGVVVADISILRNDALDRLARSISDSGSRLICYASSRPAPIRNWFRIASVVSADLVIAGSDHALVAAHAVKNAHTLSVGAQFVTAALALGGDNHARSVEPVATWLLSARQRSDGASPGPMDLASDETLFSGAQRNWVQAARIVRAFEIRLDGKTPVLDLAAQCGFGSDKTMQTAFRQFVGLTPLRAFRALSDNEAVARIIACLRASAGHASDR